MQGKGRQEEQARTDGGCVAAQCVSPRSIPASIAWCFWKARCRENLHVGFGEGRREKGCLSVPRSPPIPLGKRWSETCRKVTRWPPTSPLCPPGAPGRAAQP